MVPAFHLPAFPKHNGTITMAQVVLTPFWQVFDADGNPAAGAKASFFLAGTSTPVNVFSDSTLVTPHAVPVVADSEGRFPTIYAAAGDYKIKVTDSADVDLAAEVDNWTVLANLTQTIVSFPTVTKTTNYTVVAGDRGKVIEVDPAGATLVVTLEAATLGAGFPVWVVNTGATGTVELQFDGGETLLDLTTYSLTDKHQGVGITSRGAAGWRLIAAVTLERLATVVSAGTIVLGDGGYHVVTGTTGITDVDFTNDIAGHKAWVKFSGILTLTNSGTLILPGGSITTAAGDTALFASEGSDVVRCLSYNRATGAGLTSNVTDLQVFTTSGTWTDPGIGTHARVRLWAPGGSGGKGNNTRPGGGGGGGGFREHTFPLSALAGTEAVTIGVGGAAQATLDTIGNPGSGPSTFGSLLSAFPGGGGGGGAVAGGGSGGGAGGAFIAGTNGSATGSTAGQSGGFASAAFAALAGGTVQGNGTGGSNPNSGTPGFVSELGGGGGGGTDGALGGSGGPAIWGGAGGGGGAASGAGGPGGVSKNGGNGGAGAFDSNAATAGSAPGGGGGGSELATSGAGANGRCEVLVFTSDGLA